MARGAFVASGGGLSKDWIFVTQPDLGTSS